MEGENLRMAWKSSSLILLMANGWNPANGLRLVAYGNLPYLFDKVLASSINSINVLCVLVEPWNTTREEPNIAL